MPFIIAQVPDSSANAISGLQPKDAFLSLNGMPFKYVDQSKEVLKTLVGQDVEAEIVRDGSVMTLPLHVNANATLGVILGGSMKDYSDLGYFNIITKEYGFFESFVVGFNKFTSQISSYGVQLKKIFNPSTGAYKGVGGFKAIYDVFPSFWSWEAFWSLTAFLSIMLGVLNLLPIPALDGGHVVFLLFEMVSGKKPSEKFLERAQMVGFFILIGLVVFANGNDIFKALFN
jgi:regulator of sigma E protease